MLAKQVCQQEGENVLGHDAMETARKLDISLSWIADGLREGKYVALDAILDDVVRACAAASRTASTPGKFTLVKDVCWLILENFN